MPGAVANLSNNDESAMRKSDLEVMDFDELWLLHEELTKILSEKIIAEKLELEKRLAQLNRPEQVRNSGGSSTGMRADRPPRRSYPKVLPKYYNPTTPTETWSGRGKKPRWLVAALQSGHKLEDFKIENAETRTDDLVQRS